MRAFVAAPVGERLEAALASSLEPLRAAAPALKWVPPERWHLTLRFLGEIDEGLVPRLAALLDALAAEAAEEGAVALAPRALTLFPSGRRPRLVALVFERAPAPLTALVRRLEAGVVRLGIEPEHRSFRPHLTLARLRAPRDARPLEAPLAASRRRLPPLAIASLRLYRSVLRPRGPEYTVLHEALLRRRGAGPGLAGARRGE